MKSLLKFITCGSVDDGKSTLIGHMLYDAKLIFADQKKALEMERDLYEYQKNIEDQTTEISKLQKQIASLSNDDSEENRAKLQELNQNLKEAKENLEETQYDQFISDQKKLLSALYD